MSGQTTLIRPFVHKLSVYCIVVQDTTTHTYPALPSVKDSHNVTNVLEEELSEHLLTAHTQERKTHTIHGCSSGIGAEAVLINEDDVSCTDCLHCNWHSDAIDGKGFNNYWTIGCVHMHLA